MKQQLFYATRRDIEPVLEHLHQQHHALFTLSGHFQQPSAPQYDQGIDIPDLGTADSDSAISCSAYLVSPQHSTINVREIRARVGEISYAYDQLANPDTVLLSFGGMRSMNCLLHGRVSCVSSTGMALEIFQTLAKSLKKHFRKVKAFYVGDEALSLHSRGVRLTISVQAAPQFDLRR